MNSKSKFLNIEFVSACSEKKLYPEDIGFEIAICGRSNSGKSSIINALANSKKLAKTSNTPGRTQSINFFKINQNDDHKLVDLPGYGYAKASKAMKRDWGVKITDYMKSRDSLKGVILIMDIRHPFQEADYNFLEWCHSFNLPIQLLLNKADKLSRNKSINILRDSAKELSNFSLLDEPQIFSAKTFDGVDELVGKIKAWIES
jgi:GTP-binding protein|tara:strand:- start:514 stop:1122 length:609 start_codon:yes stop_codon:yes gene_type:complete